MHSEHPTPVIREIGADEREALLQMYRTFEPLGVAQGLPPRGEQARQDWVDRALAEQHNLGAFSERGEAAGHVFLAASGLYEAELAAFVHQDFRQRRIGTALVRSLLDRGLRAGLKRVWALVASENIPALRLLKRCGFQTAGLTFPVIEMELRLPQS